MKKNGITHVEITLILVAVISLLGILIAFTGQNQDYKEKDKTEITDRY